MILFRRLSDKELFKGLYITPKFIYIFEFKLDKSAEAAIVQIKEKEYYQKYLLEKKEVILVGVNFDSKTVQIENWIVE